MTDDPGAYGPSDDEPTFGGFDPAPAPNAPGAYRVLARKYRPQTFDDLIGQEAMVRTLTNAFASDRIPQAWMLTGVRGIGKTTTARILARALNYDLDGALKPTVAMTGLGSQCRAIMESRHVDVLEIDAASHTGVDNIRQITDAVRYAPVQARYKVYIVDEVHMLSTAAFNAFLKTLEEPPPHAKFIFATTEIRKVPVTVLSRCQRFDLRRIDATMLGTHLANICRLEEVTFEQDALAAIARAAEGSVRDSLSLLDQAIAHGAGRVSAESVRNMLGLADRGQVIDLFEATMRGDVPAAFATLRAGWDAGAEPRQMLEDLAQFTHFVTRIKLVPDVAKDPAYSEAERSRGADFAARLSIRVLSRAWQILLKALGEVGGAQRPLQAAEMVIVRLAYAADLPTPDEVLRRLRDGMAVDPAPVRPPPVGGGGSGSASLAPPGPPAGGGAALQAASGGGGSGSGAALAVAPAVMAAAAPPVLRLRRFEDVVALAGERREIGIKVALERDVRLVAFEEGRIELSFMPGAARTIPNDLSRLLKEWTNRAWLVTVSAEAVEAAPTLEEARRQRETERRQGAADHPEVQAVMRAFPGAAIVDVRDKPPPAEPEGAPVEAGADPEVGPDPEQPQDD